MSEHVVTAQLAIDDELCVGVLSAARESQRELDVAESLIKMYTSVWISLMKSGGLNKCVNWFRVACDVGDV